MVKAVVQRAREAWRGLVGPVAAAVVLAFVLETALSPAGPRVRERLLGFAVALPVAILLGVWLGRRAWPRRGRRLARALLARNGRSGGEPTLVLTERPDFEPSTARRVLEVVGVAVGASTLVATILALANVRTDLLTGLSTILVLVSLWACFVLVPYWTFAGLGLRKIDPVRWTVEPLGVRYAKRLRLSNGTLLVIALAALVQLAIRAGETQETAVLHGVVTVARIVASVLVVAATGVVAFSAVEERLLRELEAEAFALGVRDGRHLTEADLFPTPGPGEPQG